VNGEAKFDGSSRTWIADMVWKWAPEGNAKYRNFKLQGEYFTRQEDGSVLCSPESGAVGAACANARDGYRSLQSGWYAQGVYQFDPSWRLGLRHERLNSGSIHVGAAAAAEIGSSNGMFASYRPQRTSLMTDYSWSEFSRVRLQLSRDRSIEGLADNQLILQYVMSLGSHGAHRF